jgi:hypothetical protein
MLVCACVGDHTWSASALIPAPRDPLQSTRAEGRSLQAIKERREDKSRQATKSEKKAFAACALVNTGPATQAAGDDQYSKVSYGSYL